MARLRRFTDHRFVGTRDTMTVYDTDDSEQAALLQARIEEGDLLRLKMLATFGPDSIAEARNRGFRPV